MKMRTALLALADIYQRLRTVENAMDLEHDPTTVEVTIMSEADVSISVNDQTAVE